MNGALGLLARIYHLILRTYPPEFIETFSDEMYLTFLEGATEARSRGALGSFALRELRDVPRILAEAYWEVWKGKWRNRFRILRDVASPADLPPPPPDGRDSLRQAALEWSPFVLTGVLLILATYLQLEGLSAGWQRDLEFLGRVITALALPIFLLGIARGLPRWAYPFGGLLLSYHVFSANQTGLWPFLAAMVLAAGVLALMAILTDPQPSPLPAAVRRIAQSLSVDWTRLSFGAFGAMPLAILMAFDDAHANNRTPYLALSVLVMAASALVYCRSRQNRAQIAALVGGVSVSIWAALLDKVSFPGSLGTWISAPYPGAAEIAWLLQLWITCLFFILSPVLLTRVSGALEARRAI